MLLRTRKFAVISLIAVLVAMLSLSIGGGISALAADGTVSVEVDGETVEYDLSSDEGAAEYVDSYADNLSNDKGFEENIKTALTTVRSTIKQYATFWALIPPIIAILLALITKEVYSSLFIGILAGGIIYSNFNFETTVVHVFKEGFIDTVADAYNIGIIIFLVLLGALVAMMNKTGGSAAFGRWAAKHINSRIGAQLATTALGVLIFVDDYFNCLTVGSVMRPVTDKKNISREKLAYLIDATAAPVCIIAPISSWAAAVAGFAKGAGAESGMSLFIQAIPYNFYALLTIVMMIFIAVAKFDYGPMKKYETAAKKGEALGKLEELSNEANAKVKENEKGKVIDLLIPVVFLIIACVIGMIYSGGFFTAGEDCYHDFIGSFSNSDASVGLVFGSFITIIFAIIYFMCRRVISFKDCMEAIPEGFNAMTPAILILVCAWTLKTMTDSLGAAEYVAGLVANVANNNAFMSLLPAFVFLIGCFLSFATGTSWGTFGILIPIVVNVFNADLSSELMIISISACMAGAVCGDHCSPISDTTIMASAGAQCDHILHVSTQLPYAMTAAAVSLVCYLFTGFIRSWILCLPLSVLLMVVVLLVIKKVTAGNAAAAK